MRRFYVCPKDVYNGTIATQDGRQLPRYALFDQLTQSHYLDLGMVNGVDYILVSGDFDNENLEELWHQHPDVGHLFHPALESFKTINKLSTPDYKDKRFTADMLTALGNIGVLDTHTVWDVHFIAQSLHPNVRLSNTY